MATTTSASRTQASKTTNTNAQVEAQIFTLPSTPKSDKLMARLSEAKIQKAYWEKEEKAVKVEIKNAVGAQDLPEYVPLIIRLRGAIRAKITWGTHRGTDRDLLLQGFPEAFEATNVEAPYQMVTPA